jgi:hypothetical protein
MPANEKPLKPWTAVMDETNNPLRNYSLPTAHLLMQLLAWMWSVIFSVSLGSYVVFGVTSVAHLLLIGGIFITVSVFHAADNAG